MLREIILTGESFKLKVPKVTRKGCLVTPMFAKYALTKEGGGFIGKGCYSNYYKGGTLWDTIS